MASIGEQFSDDEEMENIGALFSDDEKTGQRNVSASQYPDYEDMRAGLTNFEKLLSGVKENIFLNKNENSDSVKYFERVVEHFKWEDSVLRCYFMEDKKDYISLNLRDLWSIVETTGWLEDAAVNAILSYHFKNKEIGYINTSLLQGIESPVFSKDTPTPFKDDKNGYVAVKNIHTDHWIFVYISYNDKTLYVLNPFYSGFANESIQMFQSFKNNHHNKFNSKEKSKWNFEDAGWKIGQIEHTIQEDHYNCGVICINFALQVLCNYPKTPSNLLVPKNLYCLRQLYTAILLKNSEILKPKLVEIDQNATKDVPDRNKDETSSEFSGSEACIKGHQKISGIESSKDDVEEENKTKLHSELDYTGLKQKFPKCINADKTLFKENKDDEFDYNVAVFSDESVSNCEEDEISVKFSKIDLADLDESE